MGAFLTGVAWTSESVAADLDAWLTERGARDACTMAPIAGWSPRRS